MALNCGIVGLPNVGKSTLFSALTNSKVLIANYPFATIDPNVGIIAVEDERLEKINKYIPTQKIIPTTIEFIDIAGLVAGASKGEGLGNQFLSHIREVDLIVQVVRCFENKDIVHVDNKVDPLHDIEVLQLELCLKDLDTVEKRLQKVERLLKTSKEAHKEKELLEKLQKQLEKGSFVKNLELSHDEKIYLKELQLLTNKPMIYLCNIDENTLTEKQENPFFKAVLDYCQKNNEVCLSLCVKLEAEIIALPKEERKDFKELFHLKETGLNRLAQKCYDTLGLKTFFTAGEKEIRAWTFIDGMKAPQMAGIIHSDFEKGFIKAEIYSCEDLFTFHSEAAIRNHGKLRMEGKDYIGQDGDIVHFRFNN